MEPMVLVFDTKRRIDYEKIFSYYGIDIHNPEAAKEQDIENTRRDLLDAKFVFTDESELTDVTVEMVRSYRDKYFDKYEEYWTRVGITKKEDIEYAHNCYSVWIQRLREWRWALDLLLKIKDIHYKKYPFIWKPKKPTTWNDVFRYMAVVNAEDDVLNIIKATIESEKKLQEKKKKRIIPGSCNGVYISDLKLNDLLGIENNKIEY